MRVDSSNDQQALAWDGDQGAYWADHAERFNAAVSRYHGRLLEAAEIGPTSRVLDIGCGSGKTTRDAARLAREGTALGIDLSSRMLAVARVEAERSGVTNVEFLQADAQIHAFGQNAHDVAVSRTGVMFFGDPLAAFTNIRRSLSAKARLALLVWQPLTHNEWMREIATAMAAGRDLPTPPPDAPGPFSLSDPGRTRDLLVRAGFADPRFDPITEPMYFGSDADDAQRFIAGLTHGMLSDLEPADQRRALESLRTSIEAHTTTDGVRFGSAAWLITAEPLP